ARTPERLVAARRGFVAEHALLEVPFAGEQLRREPIELGAEHGRELSALFLERGDAGLGAREAPEVQVEIGEIEERLASGLATPRATPHVEARLELLDGPRDVPANLEEAGEVRADRRERPRIARAFRRGDRALVGRARLVVPVRALQREGERHERDRLDPRDAVLRRARAGALERRERLVVLA